MRLRFVLVSVAMMWPLVGASADVEVHVKRQAEAFDVEASADLQADVAAAWEVLTDYAHLAEFIPDMHVSRVVFREVRRAEIEQTGEARFLFFGYPIEVRLAVTEYPRERIVSRPVAGNFREMRGEYRLEATAGRLMLRYPGHMVPDFDVPPLLGTLVLRRHVHTTFGALANEIERRHAGRASPSQESPSGTRAP